ncbi:MAG: sugar phosphate isomerase/epimerase [Solirubrobacterales bacterium]
MIAGRPLGFIAGLGFEERPAESVASSLLEIGYDGVEWTMAHAGEMREPALALACQRDLVSGGGEALRETLEALERAHSAGVGIVDVVAGPNLWEPGAEPRDDEGAWSVALASLETVCERAAQLGVAVGFEPCWGTIAPDAERARRVLDAVPVGITFDPSHFVISGDPIPDLVDEWAPRLVHVHLKDAFGSPGMEGEDFHFCLLGEGGVPWAGFLGALDRAGYAGPMCVEFEAFRYYEQVLGRDPEAAARLAFEQVGALAGGAEPGP